MLEAVERAVPLSASYAQVAFSGQEEVTHFRLHGRPAEAEECQQWASGILRWRQDAYMNAEVFASDTPLGPLSVLRLSIAFGEHSGYVWYASNNQAFPSSAELAVLRAAASLAGSSLHASKLAIEREEASRAKDEFLAMLGHELRNPLAPIVTALGMIKMKQKDRPREYEVIERQVGHLRRLVNDLLDVSRNTRGNVELQLRPIDLKSVLTRAVEDVQSLLEQRRHSLKLNLLPAKTWVEGDETRLTQVFVNLLTNAAKYTDPGGEITVSMRAVGDRIVCSVKDNGSGISPRLFPKLFTIFEQGTSTIDRRQGGLGIGLALVRSFVERHGGTVVANSAGVGCGSEFSVTLPLLMNGASTVHSESSSRRQFQVERILIVDDNLDALETLQSCLVAEGHVVATADNGHDALAIVAEFRPSVAILDIGLPEMDGYELAKRLRRTEVTAALRLYALTGYGQAKDREKALNAGFDDHFVKPVALEDLFAAIHRPQ